MSNSNGIVLLWFKYPFQASIMGKNDSSLPWHSLLLPIHRKPVHSNPKYTILLSNSKKYKNNKNEKIFLNNWKRRVRNWKRTAITPAYPDGSNPYIASHLTDDSQIPPNNSLYCQIYREPVNNHSKDVIYWKIIRK